MTWRFYLNLNREIFLCAACAVGLAAAATLQLPTRSATDTETDTSPDCVVQGDGDIYGLGVRLGLYLQWLAALLLRIGGRWKRKSAVRAVTNVISGSLLISVVISIAEGSALSVDYLAVYYLTCALFYAEAYNLERLDDNADDYGKGGSTGVVVSEDDTAKLARAREQQAAWAAAAADDNHTDFVQRPTKIYGLRLQPDFPLLFQNLIFVAHALFSAWFWLRGLDTLPPLPCGRREYGALFGLFPLRSAAWRHFATFAAVVSALLFLFFLAVHVHRIVLSYRDVPHAVVVVLQTVGRKFNTPTKFAIFRAILRPEVPLGKRLSRSLLGCVHYFLVYIAGPLVAIISVERMLVANNIHTSPISESTGQVISLLSGVFALVMAFWDLIPAKLLKGSL